jgi:hypothetical protein
MRRSLSVVVVAGLLVGAGVALASPKPLPLRDRLIRQGELPGFRVESTKQSFKTAEAWVAASHLTAAQAAVRIARLRREGFVAALAEFLDRGSVRKSGVSSVAQFGSAASARSELKAALTWNKALTTVRRGSFSAFSVPTIPGARGYESSGRGVIGENILFADGPFVYLVGQGWYTRDKPPARTGLITAATTLYRRVHGHPAG